MFPNANLTANQDQFTVSSAVSHRLTTGRRHMHSRSGRSLAERLLQAFRSSGIAPPFTGTPQQLAGYGVRQRTSRSAARSMDRGAAPQQPQQPQQSRPAKWKDEALKNNREIASSVSTRPPPKVPAGQRLRLKLQGSQRGREATSEGGATSSASLGPQLNGSLRNPSVVDRAHPHPQPPPNVPAVPQQPAQQPPAAPTSATAPSAAAAPPLPPQTPVATAVPNSTMPAAPSSSSSSNGSSAVSSSAMHVSSSLAGSLSGSLDTEDLPEEAIAEVYPNELPPDVHVVDTVAEARAVAARLAAFTPQQLARMVFGCDTEVMDIDVSAQSPCCHGRVICFSIYCGPEHHWGPEAEPEVKRSMIWVDTYLDGQEERQGEVSDIVEAFRPFFESRSHLKVWHNYSFDRHVLERLGYRMAGFGGDTMHMARLWDSSRMTKGGYSLEALSGNPEIMGEPGDDGDAVRGKVSMKKLFGRRNLKKDGTEGKLVVLPAMDELQRDPHTKWKWVNYSAYDAKSTWDLHAALASKLGSMGVVEDVDPAVAQDLDAGGAPLLRTMLDVYRRFYLPFGELLTDMEAAGLAVDRAHLAEAQLQAERDEAEAKERFRSWAAAAVPDALHMNVSSGPQVSQLLFAGVDNKSLDKEGVPLERVFKVPNTTGYIAEGAKKAKKTRDIVLHSVWGRGVRSPLTPEVHTPSGAPACNTAVIKSLAGKAGKARKALAELEAKPDTGFERDDAFLARSEAGDGAFDDAELADLDEDGSEWSTDSSAITRAQIAMQQAALPRDPADLEREAAEKGYGKLYSHFGTAEAGLRACAAVDALVDVSAIDTLLSNFIVPLQSDAISKPDPTGVPRVHCSLNINTETGRLSARRPNLQNQPALEKDRYKVRKAFTADVAAGKTLVVADYGQLELRILAHMAGCKSMIEAFELGGDFHSRTALGMYDHIKEAIAAGKCLLEWKGGESGEEPPPAPLLKDLFASERRKAKVLNFSIAYGKTAHGLSKDWGVSLEEAEDTVRRWYSDRPEVKAWQDRQRKKAETEGYVCTLLGRRRQLPDAISRSRGARGHALRAAINTPIQGSAADVAMAAMIRINNDPELAELGYKLLLQVHDEVILEGPREHAEAARRRVIECMRSPFSGAVERPLLVELVVDCKFADTWYEAK